MAEKNMNNIDGDYVVIWLDSNIEKTRTDKDTSSLIRRMVRGNLFTCNNIPECVNYIFTEITNQRIIFIVSNSFGPKILPLLHDVPKIQVIYVFCRDRPFAESWSKSYDKISHIFTNKQDMLHQIRDDMGASGKDDDLPMSIFHLTDRQHSVQEVNEESAKFMWYQSIILVLRSMAKFSDSKADMIEQCRAEYHNNKIEQKKIKDFEDNYTPNTAFRWYTSDSFVYRLLNKALRTQNIEIIFKFRFFINDLHNQIQALYRKYLGKYGAQTKNGLTVYRGQRMTMTELESLRNNINQLISMNSFLSATTIREIAEIFADTSDQHDQSAPLQSVLFSIEIRDITGETTAFASIQDYSCNPDEEEILFTIGAIFKVKSVTKNPATHVWHVHLQLNKQQNEACEKVFDYMKNQIGPDPSPTTLGWFLFRISEFNKAERFIQLLIKELPPDDVAVADAYNLLGLIYKAIKKYTESIRSYEKALDIYSRSCHRNSSSVIAIHCNLALAYLAIDDDRSAGKHYKLAAEKFARPFHKRGVLLGALIDTVKGKIQTIQGDYKQAFETFELALHRKQKELPSDHPSIASTYNDIGLVHEKKGDIKTALAYYTQAKQICEKSLPPDHLDIAECYINIGRIHDLYKHHGLASKQYEIASKIAMNDIRE